jgi:NitT/TauT family transport system ATP-binding protein
MPGDSALELRIDAKTFAVPGRVPHAVLRDVAFTAVPGEILALLGRSGSGKSTVLRIALGLDRDFIGRVRMPPGRVGVVFQEPRLLPWLTLTENLRLVVTDGVPAPDIGDLFDTVGLPGIADRLPSELSLGMARRVALARALAVDPDTLVLDEPFASLDRRLGADLAARVADRARRRRAIVLLATHELDHALAIADRILVLSGHPATLAANEAVPDRAADPGGVDALRDTLLERFAFLGTDA